MNQVLHILAPLPLHNNSTVQTNYILPKIRHLWQQLTPISEEASWQINNYGFTLKLLQCTLKVTVRWTEPHYLLDCTCTITLHVAYWDWESFFFKDRTGKITHSAANVTPHYWTLLSKVCHSSIMHGWHRLSTHWDIPRYCWTVSFQWTQLLFWMWQHRTVRGSFKSLLVLEQRHFWSWKRLYNRI